MKHLLPVAIAMALTVRPVAAQVIYVDPSVQRTVGLELHRAFWSNGGPTWYTSNLRARANIPVSERAHLIADLSVSVAGLDDGDEGMDATFANPEVGVGFANPEGRTLVTLTAVLPLGFGAGGDDVSVLTGFLADPFWPERYVDDLVSVNAGFTPRAALGPRTELLSDVSLSAWIPTGDGNGDVELLSRYTVGLHHEVGGARLRGAAEGLAILSEGDLSFGDRTAHRILVAVEALGGGPGFFVRIPVDDALDGVDWSAGLTFRF